MSFWKNCVLFFVVIFTLNLASCKQRKFNAAKVNVASDTELEVGILRPTEESVACFPLTKEFFKVKSSYIKTFGDSAFDVCRLEPLLQTALPATTSHQVRLGALASLDPGRFIASPGLSFLRRKDLLKQAESEIQNNDPISQVITLNVLPTTNGGGIVDVWHGHEALASAHILGKKMRDLKFKQLNILIEGIDSQGKSNEVHTFRAAGFDFSSKIEHWVPMRQEYKGDPAEYDGSIATAAKHSNFELGSRTSLRALARLKNDTRNIKIGIQGGTFDPIHEGHLDMSRYVLNERGFRETIVASNFDANSWKNGASSFANRVNIISKTIENLPGINNYLSDFSKLEDTLYPQLFTERIQYLYGTDEVYWLIGIDSWAHKILLNGMLAPNMRAKYIVFPRQEFANEAIQIPEQYKDRVTYLSNYPDRALSSTKIRNTIADCKKPSPDELSPIVIPYILEKKLYKSENCEGLN